MTRVIIAEDQHVIRAALVALINLAPDLEVVADVERGDLIVETALRHRPDVAVLDIDLPGMDGLAAAEQLYDELPTCRCLILTGLTQPSHVLRALQMHVRGFLRKDAPAADLTQAIRRVAAGERVLDPELVAAALETGISPLTPRETDVLRCAANGSSTELIASTLFLSTATVRNYLSNALAKLNARNRVGAIRIAREAGWL
jgi:two-component system, NarL family, response regulator DesR